jgi:hypothetical protein
MNNRGWFAFAVVLVLALAGVMIAYDEMTGEDETPEPVKERYFSAFDFYQLYGRDDVGFTLSASGIVSVYLDGELLPFYPSGDESQNIKGNKHVQVLLPKGKTVEDLEERIVVKYGSTTAIRLP